jgi:hypothetical protein
MQRIYKPKKQKDKILENAQFQKIEVFDTETRARAYSSYARKLGFKAMRWKTEDGTGWAVSVSPKK